MIDEAKLKQLRGRLKESFDDECSPVDLLHLQFEDIIDTLTAALKVVEASKLVLALPRKGLPGLKEALKPFSSPGGKEASGD